MQRTTQEWTTAAAAPQPAGSSAPPTSLRRRVDGLVRRSVELVRGLVRLYVHAGRVRALAGELADALAESREVSSWPGDRLLVGAAVSEQVEKLTRRLRLETEAHGRLAALLR